MKVLLFIVVVAAYVAARPRRGRIFGGQDAISGQFPFIVAINDDFGQYCDGAIIAPSWILTTAQCLHTTLPSAQVYVGSHLNLVNGTGYTFAEAIMHENYDSITYQNDIGLIRIDGVLEYSDTIQPIEIGEVPEPNATCTVLGWGQSESEGFPENLKYLDLTTIDSELCQILAADNLDGHYLGPEQVCTVGSMGQGICTGDAGGPLVCDGKLAGISSYTVGVQCGEELPDVHLRPGVYADWIHTHIGGM